MKVLDLRCAHEHAFEGWFAGEDDFQAQLQAGLLQCPVCANAQVRKVLSAPRINRGTVAPAPGTGTAAGDTAPAQQPSQDKAELSEMTQGGQLPPPLQAALLQWARRAAAQSEDVGERFAAEARSIHRGDSPERAIRGQASAAQTMELLQEGIAVLPLPAGIGDTLH